MVPNFKVSGQPMTSEHGWRMWYGRYGMRHTNLKDGMAMPYQLFRVRTMKFKGFSFINIVVGTGGRGGRRANSHPLFEVVGPTICMAHQLFT